VAELIGDGAHRPSGLAQGEDLLGSVIHACWTLGANPDYRSVQRWAHMLGFGGHFLTKARAYSIRFRDLREARITYRRHQDTGPEHGPIRSADHTDDETILIIGTYTYAGTGWKTTSDWLA
jgi:hypothetical protein